MEFIFEIRRNDRSYQSLRKTKYLEDTQYVEKSHWNLKINYGWSFDKTKKSTMNAQIPDLLIIFYEISSEINMDEK